MPGTLCWSWEDIGVSRERKDSGTELRDDRWSMINSLRQTYQAYIGFKLSRLSPCAHVADTVTATIMLRFLAAIGVRNS